MAITPRFSTVDKALLVATGNSLLICGDATAPSVNTSDLIKPDGTTTRDWTQSGSTAHLSLLPQSTVLYAELVWHSTVFSNVPGTLDLRSVQDTPISFTTTQGTYQITPQNTESYTSLSGSIDRYRAADVTTYVQAALSGDYTVSQVPISIPSSDLSNSRAGWTLSVIYRHNNLIPQKVLYASGIFPATPDMPYQSTFTGFTTSSDASLLKGNMILCAANGGPLNGQESVYVGPSFAQLRNIGNPVNMPHSNPGTAPNNPGNSFFSGTINVANPLNPSNGLLNISGTNGTQNHDGFVPTQTLGARNKWDLTNVDLSSTLVPNQTLLASQITTGELDDGVQLIVLGTQVAAKAPNIITTLTAYDIDGDAEYNVEVNEALVYALQIKNDGDLAANQVNISAALATATSFVPGSVLINGVASPSANISSGISLGTIPAHSIMNVFFTVKILSVPAGGLLRQTANYSYQFISGIDTLTNSGNTNAIEVIVQDGTLEITQSASTTSLALNDTVTYTFNIENTGTELAKELFFQDKLDPSCSFVSGTVMIGGVAYEAYNPVNGFALPNLSIGAQTQITFQAKLSTLPASTKVPNKATISFGYTFNQYGYLRKRTLPSNTLTLSVLFVNVVGDRATNNSYPHVGDTVTYTLNLTNIGTAAAVDVAVQEPTISGASFVEGSVKINGSFAPTRNPFTGFALPNAIAPKATTAIEYQVVVNALNPTSLIQNTASIPFKYEVTPGGAVVDHEQDSNTVDTVANYVCMNITKAVDKTHATIDDILYYTININNTGNISATDTLFLDPLQAEVSFVTGSVTINGISYPDLNPVLGFSLGLIDPSDLIEIAFQAKVNALPTPHFVDNQGSLVYSYKPDPTGTKLSNTVLSNTVQTIINTVSYTVTKSVDKTYAQVGDQLVYTTTINNTGTVPLTNMSFSDFTGIFLAFQPGTVSINGVNYPDYIPDNQFPIGMMLPGDTKTIVFSTTIVSNPPVGYIPNMSEVLMTYQVNPNTAQVTQTVYSNVVKTYDPYATLSLVKNVDKAYAVVGDTLTYSFTATNTGNATASNTLFSDILPSAAAFVAGSVMINGISKPNYDPQAGFTLGDLFTGQTVTVSFQAAVTSVPTPNTIKNTATTSFSYYVNPDDQPVSKTVTSNTVTTVINAYSATLTKYVDKAYATINDELSYSIMIANTGNIPLTNVTFIDTIPAGATFVAGSVKVDGVSKPDFSPHTGFAISNVLPGGNVEILFKVNVSSMPTPPEINNTARTTFSYQLTPTSPVTPGNLTSNTVTTLIKQPGVTNVKHVNKAYATQDDVLTYTSIITNTGTTPLDNTTFIDNLASHLTFVAGSVKIDTTSYPDYAPYIGFTLGSIPVGVSVTVTFDATVTSIPPSGYVTNTSNLNYDYKIDPAQPYYSSSITSNTVTTFINYGNVSITKSANQTIVKLRTDIVYSFVVANTGNIPLKNLFFKDTVQAESLLTPGSVSINEINYPDYDPNIGFNLPDIPVGQQTTIHFTVVSNSLPSNNALLNTADLTYSYFVDPSGSATTKTKASNTTTVYVYDTMISATKAVDKVFAKLTDTLNFTITLKNDGNIPAQHIFFKDTLDSHITLVPDSVVINGAQKLGYDPSTGFNLDDIEGNGSTTTVTFAATINSRPPQNSIPNFATIDYDYLDNTQVISATITTNTTQTYVAISELTVTKAVDKDYATLNDYLTYTVTIQNTGSVDAIAMSFQDLIPNSTSFVPTSVIVDGTPQPLFDPAASFDLASLTPNQSHTVVFGVRVDTLPANGKVDNIADITFTYRPTPTDDPVTTTTHSNTVTTLIKRGELTATKSVDKAYATLGNTLNYTINIDNIANTTCFDVFFQDMIQSHASFVPGSVKINDITYESYNPNDGFYLPDVPGADHATVTFAVTVQSLPPDTIIYNHASANYKYLIDPAHSPVTAQVTTNTVTTHITIGALTATKAVSKAYAMIDDVLTYTVTLVNTGNTPAKYVNFRDVIPAALSFVAGSVQINDMAYPAYDPYASFSLGNILPGDTVVVVFDTKVTTLPTPSLVSNTAEVTFFYRIDPSGSDTPVVTNSNTVTTQIIAGALTLTKSVDLSYAAANDSLTYTVVVTNSGNTLLENVLFTDNLQSDITFNTGSIKINNTPYPDYVLATGFSLGNIEPLDAVTVSFTVTVISAPLHDSVLNYAVGTFSYKVDPNGQSYYKSTQSNTVTTFIIMPKLSASKIVNKAYATLQDTLNYSVLVKNEGNTTLRNLIFTDFLSTGATFVPETLSINGTGYPAYDPTASFSLPFDLLAGNTALVEFQTLVTTLPSPPQVTNYASVNGEYSINPEGPTYPISTTSNTVTTAINTGSLAHTKAVDKLYANVNDTIIYTSTITNTGNVNATNLFFSDALESALSFISGTVTIDDTVYPALNPVTGFSLLNLAPGQTTTVTFTAKINSLPTPAYVSNTANINFSYKIDPAGVAITKDQSSNTVTTNVVLGKIVSTKAVDKSIATIGDVLTYTITLTNTGNVIANDVLFKDIPSTGVTFKPGSVKVNGVSEPLLDPTTGFSLGNIGIGNVVNVEFAVDVTSVPATNQVTNQATITFKFVVDPKELPYDGTTYSNTVTTNIAYGNLTVTKAVNKQYATIGEQITYTITIVNSGNINATNVVFLDPTPHNSTFVIGSVTVNGTPYPDYNPSAGFNLNTMTPGQIITVVYKVQVINLC